MRAYHSQLGVASAAAALAGARPAKDSGMLSLDCWDGTRGGVLRAEHASISSEILSDADLESRCFGWAVKDASLTVLLSF